MQYNLGFTIHEQVLVQCHILLQFCAVGPSSKHFRFTGIDLAQVPWVHGTHRIFEQYCLAHADFGNFDT